MRAVGALLLGLIKTLISMWELLTNWAYTILTQPASKLDDYRRTLAAPKEQIKETWAKASGNQANAGGKG